MSKRLWWLRLLLGLVALALLAGGGYAIYQAGWGQGYAAGQVAVEGEEGAAAPFQRGWGYPMHHVGFSPFYLLLGVGLALVAFRLIGACLFAPFWRRACWAPGMMGRGAGFRRWHRGGPWRHFHHHGPHHGPMEDCCCEPDAEEGAPGEQTGPDETAA